MQNTRISGRYAKSLIDLAIEQNKLDEITAEVKALVKIVDASAELKALLRSPIIKANKKLAVLQAIFGNSLSPLVDSFVKLVVKKGRESILLDILAAYIGQYNDLKGISQVKLTTATPVKDNTLQSILSSIQKTTPLAQIELETSIDESLIGGYVLELKDYLVDASIKRELALVKRRFVNNEYQYNIR